MTSLCAILILVSLAVAVPATWAARAFGRRINALDGGGVMGQVKDAPRKVPNTGGIGLFLGVTVPLAAAMLVLSTGLADILSAKFPAMQDHLPGLITRLPMAASLLAGLLTLHIIVLIDDRPPL